MYEFFRGFTAGLAPDRERCGPVPLSSIEHGERTRIESFLKAGNSLALHLFEIENFFVFSSLYGEEITAHVTSITLSALKTLARDFCPTSISYVEPIEKGKFLLLCGHECCGRELLPDISMGIRLKLKSSLKTEALKLTGQSLEVKAGHAYIPSLNGGLEHALYQGLCDAQKMAAGGLDHSRLSLLSEFRNILDGTLITSAYQPIVDLSTGAVIA